MKHRLLFVDDEPSIRLTLATILSRDGFEVTVAQSVAEALRLIQENRFDILLSDLNIGEPGDGFTVVSAMRRTQPEARTFILTGYPDFESALTAIRNQVDGYFTKPADLSSLVQTLREASATRERRPLPAKRISVVIRENQEQIIEHWLESCDRNPELSRVALSRQERMDNVQELLREIADRIDGHSGQPDGIVPEAAIRHGLLRRDQAFTAPMLLVESSILEKSLAALLQEHLLSIDISTLITDMHQMSDAINCAAEFSVRALLGFVSLDDGIRKHHAPGS